MKKGLAILGIVLGCALTASAQGSSTLHYLDFSSNARPAVLMMDGHRLCETMFPPDECVVQIGQGRHAFQVVWPNEPDPNRSGAIIVKTDPFIVTVSSSAYYFCSYGPGGSREKACQEFSNNGRVSF